MRKIDFVMRSMMFVPGHNERLLNSAARSNADAIIIDLEDSVLPVKNKSIARELSSQKMRDGLLEGRRVFVRINNEYKREDVQAYAKTNITGFVLPKVETHEDIAQFGALLSDIEQDAKLSRGSFKIVPLIETTRAILNIQDIASVSDRVIALTFGREDYVADLEGVFSPDLSCAAFEVPRALMVMAARAAGILPIDTVYLDINDLNGFAAYVHRSRALGFEGTLILHPKQIPIAHNAYSPSIEELEHAQEIFELAKRAKAEDKGVAYFEGRFVGPPLVVAAKKLLHRQKLIQQQEQQNK